MIGLNTLISHIKSRTRRRSTLLGGTLALTLGVSTFAWNVHAIERASNKTQIKFLDLTPEAKPTENMIRLDWNKLDEHTYQVYQKREGENEFQSVSMTDLSKTKQVKVLNLYPTVEGYTGVIYDTAYTTWDGESIPTLPKSASLKRWMEEPNHEHSKGYGRGLIEVTPVSLQEFNKTPLTYLKNTDGTWKYDVVMIGSWDNNGLNDDITKDGRNLLIEFLDSNRGILFGHDTIRGRDTGVDLSPYLNSLHEYIKLEINDIDFSKIKWHRSTTVELSKKGLLTNYPWMIGDVGETLTIPESHTVDQLPGGDVWVKFKGKTAYDEYNYYLTTWNNAAMIQTGHSNGEATSDEQKILANTLFYLNQLSDVNYLNDHSGQDVKAPDKPIMKSTKALSNGYVEVTFDPLMDQGSSYEYYVKATHKNGNSSTISDIKTETITSGVAGVSYVIDTHSTTEPDNTIDALSNNKLSVKANSEKNTYIHIKTIDHAGNVSETQHFTISAPPALRSEVVDNQYVRLDWATEILPENMIYQTGFEPGDDINPTAYLGGMSISENNCHQGNQCLLMQNASTQGNNGGNDGSTTNRYDFNPVYGLDINMKFSASLWVKNIGEETDSDLFIGARGGVPKTSEPFHVKYGLSNPIIVAEDTSKTPNLIKIKDFNTFSNSLKNDFIYSASTAISTNYEGEWLPFNKTNGLVPSQEGIYVPDHLSANYKKGDILHSTDYVYPLVLSGPTTPANGEWTLYNFNGDILDYDYDTALRGLIPFINSDSDGGMYIDDIRFGHATKVKLYRNHQVIYEGYDAKLDDYSATDKEKPNMVDADSVIASFSNNQVNINFNQATDNGSSYTYYVEPLDKNNNAGLPSDKKTEVITSGIAGYSFVIDQNKTTSPDAIIDTTSTTIQQSLVGNKDYYLHIRTIDKNGNVSDTAHIKLEGLKLTAEAKPSKNMIRLDWTAVKDSLYQVYQKKESSNKFESIGRSLETVKVLNVYPTSWEYSTFTTWDGETLTLPVGGMLKKWMEEPNPEHPKGYGQGLIEVTPVDFTSFNQNPTSYLKQNSDGSWNYDVVMVGSYDCNGDCNSYSTMNFSASTEQFVSEFISQGYGVLLGHDFRSLTNKVETEGIPAVEPVGSSLVKLSKKGILTNFPWNLGEMGTILNIPYAHNSGPYVEDSDIWIKFEGNNDPNYCYYGHYNWCRPDQFWSSSTNNHYLAIKNNVAMIQTGHSGGSSTPDEQKIIANTLFFLKQISDQNHLNDYSGQDVKAPNKPVSKSIKALSDGYVEITFDTLTDQGSTYEYYVKATHKNGNSSVVSNIEIETITSGIAGVSYVIDTNLDTKPDDQLDNFSNNKIKVKPNSSQTTYLHIKIIDNAGNSSETEHIMISVPKINTAEQHNKAIHLNWDIGIPQNSILFQTDFESTRLDYSQEPALEVNAKTSSAGKYVDPYGSIWPLTHPIRNSIKILPNLGLNQTSGVRVNKTTDKLGWDYHWYSNLPSPNGEANTSSVEYGEWIRLTGDRPLIGRFDVKGTGTIETKIDPGWWTGGSIEDPRFTWAEALSSSEFWHRLNQNIPIEINNSTGESEQNYHLATALDRSFSYNYLLAQGDIYQENGQWYYKCTAYAYAWKDWVRPEQFVTPDDQRTVSSISVGQPLYVLESQEGSSNKLKINSTDWTTYSFNLTVPNTEILNALNYYFFVSQTFETADYLQLDNLTVAYAPKSRLYRNGQLILEDFTVEHTDQDVKDTTAPEKALVSVDYVDGEPQLTWQEVKDKGTIYTYEVSNIDENGQESLRSEPKDVEFISGIKEYRIYLNGTLIDTTTNPNYQFQDELTPSDRIEIGVVDEAGNESKTEIEFLNLTAEAKPSENMIRLDWNVLNEHTYQVYQKKEGNDEFQSISMTDLSKTKQVQVLNIYPVADHIPSETFTTWEGQSYTLPKSASLKRWMEEPNSEHPKGYGQGLIHVTSISIDEFNTNSENLLKQIDGSWKYDVLVIGTWDNNGNTQTKINNLLNSTAISNILDFTNSGKGLLVGHDVVNNSRDKQWHIDFVPLLKLENATPSITGDDEVYVNKKGLLVTYPWDITETETLNIPMTHTSRFISKGDVWLKYVNPLNNYRVSDDDILIEDESGTNNHYLTTWQNTAMIQTGHSDGEATSDEQKILANTIFYLNQLSSDNYLNDQSGQDVKAPDKPTTQSTQALSDGFVEITFDTLTDQGSTYDYYVRANHKNGSSSTISNIETETITSGIAGVSYVIDTNSGTEPDNQLDSFNNHKIKVKPNSNQVTYLHIKVIDKAGNVSETEHISISIPKINIAEQRDETIYVNWDIEIPSSNIFFQTDFENLDLNLPNGNLLTGVNLSSYAGPTRNEYGNTRPNDDPVRHSLKIINGAGIENSKGVIATQTNPRGGWSYQYYSHLGPEGNFANHSGFFFNGWSKLNLGKPAIIRYSSKGDGIVSTSVSPGWWTGGAVNHESLTFAESLTVEEFRQRMLTNTPVKINNPKGITNDALMITTALDPTYSYNFYSCLVSVEKQNGQWVMRPLYRELGAWSAQVRPGQTVTPSDQRNAVDVKAGEPVMVSQFISGVTTSNELSKIPNWTNYSFNIEIPSSQTIINLGSYFQMDVQLETTSTLQIDNLQIAYAPKSRLYRNGRLILEDFTVEHTDQDVKDTTAPEKALVSGGYVDGKLQLTWQEVKDKGTIYTYEVSGVNENGQESLRSEPKDVEFISGIKEYRIYLNGTLIDTTTNPNYQFQDELTPSDRIEIGVVDEAGNESKTEVEFLHLTAEAKPSKNMIRLDWNALNEHTYQVYQKKEGSADFQSISMTDLTTVSQIKVLNIYPHETDLNNQYNSLETINFTTWKGDNYTLPKSASLKMWMETPNSEHSKGYGQGIIEVTPVEMDDFNTNPVAYLKNTDGSWKHDVIMFGTWDSNANDDLTAESTLLIKEYIEDGKGVLFGHDTLTRSKANLYSLRNYLNTWVSSNQYGTKETSTSAGVFIKRKGLLTNYPWEIGNVGDKLLTPLTHTWQMINTEYVWLDFDTSNLHLTSTTLLLESDGKTNNHYLSTVNNLALIQTGHSRGEATPDEQKILANTLFYLNQLSSNNWLDDYSGQDVKAPEKPSVSNAHALSNGYISVSLNDLIDYGSTYEYYVKAIHKSGSEQISNTVSETITTGIKGVSYVIDTNPTTEPDNHIEPLNNQTIQVKPNQAQTTYLHIKTIDNAGNVSETLHYELGILNLTAEAKPTENDGKGLVRLDWTAKPEHTYQVYQKTEDSNEFQSISTSDLSKTKQIQVLNIYPDSCLVNSLDCPNDLRIPSDSSFTTWDGETFTLPQSAKLKRWMEEPNNEHPKGYGQGLIEVTPVSFTDFNINPESYLKNSDGSWKYDVIMIGTWDSNGQNADITKLGRDLLVEFLDSNRGVLFGHDTIRGLDYGTNLSPYLNSLKDYIKLTLNDIDFSQTRWHRSTTVEISKKGLLTNYPWRIGEIGDTLTIPESHTVDQIPGGDIWIKFRGKTAYDEYNYYLTTWNNAAMVQTGHSNGEATPDEQKILANTLFYLNQLSDVNYLNDYSGQDLKAPDKPSIKNHTYTTNGFISLAFDAVKDNGSLYEYYVKATHKDGNGVASSNIASATVTTGVKGYSWIADNNPDTVPDDIIEQSNYSNIKIPTNNRGPYYLHIKAVDQAGNVSETFHYELTDVDKPTLTLTQNPTDWTNQDVIITATATDHGKVTSGIKEIILPDRNKVAGSTATFTAIQNGTYTFEAVDFMGNRQTASITISNIDKIKPTGSIIIDQNQDEFYEEDTKIHINMSDILDGQERLSGIAKVEIFDVNGTYSHTMTNPSSYQQTLPWVLVPYELPDGTLKAQIGMKLTDKAGNVVTIYSKEVTIIKLRIEEFYLTNVLNPGVYNNANPFVTLRYPNIPSQPLVTGGHFSFKVEYSYPRNADARWKIDYKEYVRYQKPDGSEEVYPTQRLKEQVNGELSSQVIIPYDLPLGTKVYLDFELILYNQNGRQIANAYFPQPENTSLLIGEIVDDIRSFLQFNEIA